MWTEDAPFTYTGKFWTVNKPDTMFDFLKPHIKPLQAPHPPIGVAGLSKSSDTLKKAVQNIEREKAAAYVAGVKA